jgi:hypothetical protein
MKKQIIFLLFVVLGIQAIAQTQQTLTFSSCKSDEFVAKTQDLMVTLEINTMTHTGDIVPGMAIDLNYGFLAKEGVEKKYRPSAYNPCLPVTFWLEKNKVESRYRAMARLEARITRVQRTKKGVVLTMKLTKAQLDFLNEIGGIVDSSDQNFVLVSAKVKIA